MFVALRVTLILALLAGMVPPVSYAAPVPFPDMAHSWFRYRDAVGYLRARDVIGGYPDGTFRPKQTINRAELLKIVFKGKSDILPSRRRCFSDVSLNAWYAPYVCAAKSRAIVSGYKGNIFKPEEPVNMAEAMKIVLHAYGRSIPEAAGERWYEGYAEEMAKNGMLSRTSYVPWDPLTRERAADLLWRVLRHDEERVNPSLSSGCGKSAPSFGPQTVMVNGQERSFLLTIPSDYVANVPSPLIVAFHGRTNSNEQVRSYYRLDRETSDAIIAYPAATKKSNGSFEWFDPRETSKDTRDLDFFDAIVEELASRYCIDMDRVDVVGHSLGAWMANSIACARGGAVRASATVGGDSIITDCAGPSAAFIAHNPKDNLASFSGAERVRDMRLQENVCSLNTEPVESTSLRCVRHTGCTNGIDVLFCPHTIDIDERGKFYPHTWPRETAREIVEFLSGLTNVGR